MRLPSLVTTLLLLAASAQAQTTGHCTGGSATSDLDIGGVRARLYNNGGLFWKGAGNVYNVPKAPQGTLITPNAVFAQGIWVGGYVGNELRQAAALYSNWEFYPGPPLDDGSGADQCGLHDRIWNVTAAQVRDLDRYGIATRDIAEWPYGLGAPVVDGDGVPDNYNLAGGDRPKILGHQTAFWVMNDAGGPHNRTGSKPMGLEVRVTAHAFRSPSDALHYSTVYRYTLINRSPQPITQAYFGGFSDPDIGNASDDYVGSDSALNMGYTYNADNFDEGSDGYGTAPPALGWQLLDGPPVRDTNGDGRPDAPGLTAFVYFNSGSCNNCDPRGLTADFYNLLRARWQNGQRVYACGNGAANQYASCGTTGFMFSGDPTAPPGQRFWSEFEPTRGASTPNAPSDRRFVLGSGPFTLESDVPVTFTLAMVWARGANNLDSVTRMKAAAREVQAVYDATGFRNLPERPYPASPQVAPHLVSPADGASGQPSNLLLTWAPVPGADSYEMVLTGLDAPEASTTLRVTEASVRLPFSPYGPNYLMLPQGRYTWRVRGVNEGGVGGWSETYSFAVGAGPVLSAGILDFLTTRNASGPLDPPEYAAFAFNSTGFPYPTTGDRPNGTRQQTTGGLGDNAGWGIFTFGNRRTYQQWLDWVTRGGLTLSVIGQSDYEWRFTGTSLAWRGLDGDAPPFLTVPFELWSTGTEPGPEDDVRMIPAVCESACGAGAVKGVFDIGGDSPLSGGIDDPITDAVYWHYPTDRTPGAAGYHAWAAAAAQGDANGAQARLGPEAFARMVLMGWNMGTSPATYKMKLPEPGTVFRIVTTKLDAPILSAPADGQVIETRQALLAWQEPAGGFTLRRIVEVGTDAAFAQVVVRDSSASEAQLRTPALLPGRTYYWRVRLITAPFAGVTDGTRSDWSRTGTFTAGTAVGLAGEAAVPGVLTLSAVFPNPARGPVTVAYGLPEAGPVRVRLFDLLGREAASVDEGVRTAGWHRAALDTGALAAGVYVLRLEAGTTHVTRTLVVARP